MPPDISQKVEDFFAQYRLQTHKAGHILVHAGDEPSGVYHLISGQVKEYDISDTGYEVVVNVFKPPAFFPMSWAINRTINQYFFETTSPVKLRQAPADEAVAFLKSNPDVTFNLLSRLYSGTDGLLRRMAHLMGGTAKTRLLFELLVESRRFGKKQPDGTIMLSLHQEELANRAGLSRETVSRELTRIKDLGLVEISRQGFHIKNQHKLEEELGSGL